MGNENVFSDGVRFRKSTRISMNQETYFSNDCMNERWREMNGASIFEWASPAEQCTLPISNVIGTPSGCHLKHLWQYSLSDEIRSFMLPQWLWLSWVLPVCYTLSMKYEWNILLTSYDRILFLWHEYFFFGWELCSLGSLINLCQWLQSVLDVHFCELHRNRRRKVDWIIYCRFRRFCQCTKSVKFLEF